MALYTGVLGNGAESYLLEDLFLGELLAFEQGKLLEIGGRQYFVQIRLIQHCLDTKALGKMLNVQEAAALAGCPLCVDFRGVYRSGLKKVVNGQHRRMLPLTSALRMMGNSEVCCPVRYYEQNEHITMSEVAMAAKMKQKSLQKKAYMKIVDNLSVPVQPEQPRDWRGSNINWSCEMTEVDVTELRKTLVSRATPPIWYHGSQDADNPHSFDKIEGSLHYVHCDLRKHRPFTKIKMEDFVALGKRAVRTGQVQAGVKGEWPYSRLKYVDIASDVCFDPFHAISGVCKHVLSNLKGTRMTPKVHAYCVANNVHPSTYCEVIVVTSAAAASAAAGKKKKQNASRIKRRAPWIISEAVSFKIVAHVNCILVPKTYSESFQMKNIFGLG